ncbi:structural maintenance of chromosomes protein 6-like [Amphiura filiformis]|uniref:structural maintenance of chromosomes protein 6-like n=1 Tax=Amphiura filiformis TaxID=82378 RepID=UPI003B22756F
MAEKLMAKRKRKDTSDDEDLGDLSQVADFKAQASLKEAEYGIIESIRLKNFMCHGSLFFQFGPNVNFVVGRNGSGKSAVLTGVVVGLGGKASVTNRGGSLRAFIKDNTSLAQVTIKLRNRGSDAYKPELYGNSIIIERKMTSDGGSSYKLKSADNKRTISNKKEELDHILDQFNIKVGWMSRDYFR